MGVGKLDEEEVLGRPRLSGLIALRGRRRRKRRAEDDAEAAKARECEKFTTIKIAAHDLVSSQDLG